MSQAPYLPPLANVLPADKIPGELVFVEHFTSNICFLTFTMINCVSIAR